MPSSNGGDAAGSETRALRRYRRATTLALRGLTALAVTGLCAVTSGAGCSLVVGTDADQCTTTADCTALGAGFVGSTCLDNVCVTPGTASGCGADVCCTTNQQCIDQLGPYHVCRKDTGACVGLLSTECATVDGDWASDDAFMFGSVLPTAGEDMATGKPIENAIKLAINDFTQTANGLPPIAGSAPRPLVLIGCNDASDSDTAAIAAHHLVDTLGLPAIIGAAFSGITIKMATEAAIPGGALVISPSATSVAITDLQDQGLVWRTSPSDVFQADAFVQYLPLVEAEVRATFADMGDPVKIAILHKGDAYGSGLAKALEKKLVFNGKPALDIANKPSYLRFDYGDPDDPQTNPPNFGAAVTQVLAMKPHIILVFGTNESITDVFDPVETQWANAQPLVTHKARFLFADGGLINDLWERVGTDADLRSRVRGTVPGTDNQLFSSFRSDYTTKFKDGTSPDVFGAAGGYDAAYLLAYSAVTLGAAKITGAGLANGLKRMVSGATVEVGTGDINSTFPILLSGGDIDFEGASGPLNFDVATGEAPSDIQIWCLQKDAVSMAAGSGVASGQYFDAKTGALAGAAGPQCD